MAFDWFLLVVKFQLQYDVVVSFILSLNDTVIQMSGLGDYNLQMKG